MGVTSTAMSSEFCTNARIKPANASLKTSDKVTYGDEIQKRNFLYSIKEGSPAYKSYKTPCNLCGLIHFIQSINQQQPRNISH